MQQVDELSCEPPTSWVCLDIPFMALHMTEMTSWPPWLAVFPEVEDGSGRRLRIHHLPLWG